MAFHPSSLGPLTRSCGVLFVPRLDGFRVDALLVAPREHDSYGMAMLAMVARSVARSVALACGIGERPVVAGQVRDCGGKTRIGTLVVAAAVADGTGSRLRYRGTFGAG